MKKPILTGKDPVQITVGLEWLIQFAKAIDRMSYGCGGIFTCVDGHESICDDTLKLVQMDADELKEFAK